MSKAEVDRICQESARECVRLARMTDDPERRVELFQMARGWMAMAMEQQEEWTPDSVLEDA